MTRTVVVTSLRVSNPVTAGVFAGRGAGAFSALPRLLGSVAVALGVPLGYRPRSANEVWAKERCGQSGATTKGRINKSPRELSVRVRWKQNNTADLLTIR
jgi:hypothetical protein